MTRARMSFLIAGITTVAVALGATAALFTAPAGAGGFFGRHGGHLGHRGFGHGGMHDPEQQRAHLRRATSWVLSEVDATEAQVDEVAAILGGALEDLHGLHGQHGAQRQAFGEALAGAEVDREALEALRVEGMAMADQASSRLITAIADAAAVLSEEQRQELLALHDSFHGGGR